MDNAIYAIKLCLGEPSYLHFKAIVVKLPLHDDRKHISHGFCAERVIGGDVEMWSNFIRSPTRRTLLDTSHWSTSFGTDVSFLSMRKSTEQYWLMCSFDIRLHRHFFPQFFFKDRCGCYDYCDQFSDWWIWLKGLSMIDCFHCPMSDYNYTE